MAENAGFDLKALDGDFVIPFGKKKIRIPKKVAILAVAVILGLLAFFLLPKGKESKEDEETIDKKGESGSSGVLPGAIDNGNVERSIDSIVDTPQVLPPVERVDVSGFGERGESGGSGGDGFSGFGGGSSGFGGDSGGGRVLQQVPPPQSFQDQPTSMPIFYPPTTPIAKLPVKKMTPQKLGQVTGAKLGAQAGIKLKKPSVGIHKTKTSEQIKAQKSTGAPYQGVFGSPAQKAGKAAIKPKKATGAPVFGVFGSPAQKAGKAPIKGKATKKGVGFGNVVGSAYKTGVKKPVGFGNVKAKAYKSGVGFGNVKGKATVKPTKKKGKGWFKG